MENSRSVFRVFVFTDSHLGYKERDDVRWEDSFETFEEGLEVAGKMQCDLAIHAGDMYDVQKPSQYAMQRSTRAIFDCCVGEPRSKLEVVARHDPIKQYNFEMADKLSVKMPLFMIHGNHDPPLSRDNGHDVVSAIDVLQAAHLINDIGRAEDLDQVIVSPVILKKGDSHLAIYGVGHIRDERMNRLFSLEKIAFKAPQEVDERLDPTKVFCLLLIHQNRYKGHLNASGVPAKKCVHEEMLPSFLDLVVWGHEHDCDIEPKQSLSAQYYISQPGSSVCTSLRKGEATFKRNGVLEICEKRFRFHSFPLLKLRPFIYRSSDLPDAELWNHLENEFNKALAEAKEFEAERIEDWKRSMKCMTQELLGMETWEASTPPTAKLPLIRLRVDIPHELNIDEFNSTRFISTFGKSVANPSDVVFIQRQKAEGTARGTRITADGYEVMEDDTTDIENEDPEDAIFRFMDPNDTFKLLDQSELNVNVKKYVNKSDLAAFESFVNDTISQAITHVSDRATTKDELLDLLVDFRQLRRNGEIEPASGI